MTTPTLAGTRTTDDLGTDETTGVPCSEGHTARAKEEIPVNTIHILKAVLCADCEVISDGARDTCVVCGSRSLLSLGRVLGGTIGQERAVLVPTNEKELRNMFTLLVNPGAASKAIADQRNKKAEVTEEVDEEKRDFAQAAHD